MIFLCAGEQSARAFDALILLASQLDQAGHSVGIDARFLPHDAQRYQKFEAALYLCDAADIGPSTILVIGAEHITNDVQLMLRALAVGPDVSVFGLGRFVTHQTLLNAQNKLACAMGRDVEVANLTAWQGKAALIDDSISPLLTTITSEPVPSGNRRAGVLIYVPFETLQEDDVLPALGAMSHAREFDLHVVTNGRGKDHIRQSRYAHLSVFGNSDLPPAGLLSYTDIAAIFGPNIPGVRMAQFAMEAMGAGKIVIDCTDDGCFLDTGAPALRGPADILSLATYLDGVVLPHRSEIGRRIQQNPWLATFNFTHLEHLIGLERPLTAPTDTRPSTLFFPTNGSGLGHAQRCALIAQEVSSDYNVRFAAFPSCVGMLENRGFDCMPMVQRTDDLPEEYANDLVNYRRLADLIKPGDQLVFDGGYIFDSVYRVISTSRNRAIWIRRGLWQAGQIHAKALEREHIFSKIIVPSEAFDELNTEYSRGEHISHVGPIVRTDTQSDRETLRHRLSEHFERPIDTLVVSMLGGGVASDRSVQTQMLCSTLERRKNCLHLVVAWPNAVVPDGIYGWENTVIVQTQNALDLCRAADVTVSAAGYNSFHEIMYAAIPTIFIPQSAPYLDDQERRARAAADRGLAVLVMETELMSFGRQVNAFLDGDRVSSIAAAHAGFTLPETGNRAAARLIDEGIGL